MKLLLSESNGQAFGILEMLNPAKFVFHAIIARIFFAPKADVLGIYGQNGSGKTTFIDALEILKTLLSGQKGRGRTVRLHFLRTRESRTAI